MAKVTSLDVKIGTAIAILVVIWLLMPVLAGMFKLGEPEGPKIYPAKMHAALYRMGYGAAGHGTAHSSLTSFMYERPWFYGMNAKPIPQAKAEELLDSTKKFFHAE